MKAIILSAGEGKRLMPYTSGIPKCMVKVNGKALIQHQINVLRSAGISEIIVVTGCHADKINFKGIKTYFNNRYYETNMVFSLFCAKEELKEDVIISYGDIVYSDSILKKIIRSKYDISVAIDLDWEPYWNERFDNPLDDAESLAFYEKGRIISIGKPAKKNNEIQGQYIGLTKFTNKGIDLIKHIYTKAKKQDIIQGKNFKDAYMTDLIQTVIDEGNEVWPINFNGGWVEVDTVRDLKLNLTSLRIKDISDSINASK